MHTNAVSPYDPDSQFSEDALSRLEAAGIPVLTSVWEEDKELQVAMATDIGHQLEDPSCELLEMIVYRKLSRTRPPTWRSLHEVLRKLDLEELSQEIEEYLSCELISYHYMHA